MIVLCKEYDKHGNRKPAHYIVKKRFDRLRFEVVEFEATF